MKQLEKFICYNGFNQNEKGDWLYIYIDNWIEQVWNLGNWTGNVVKQVWNLGNWTGNVVKQVYNI